MKQYTYEETPETIAFWEDILRELYGNDYKEVEWFPPNSIEDVEWKQDLAVIMISDAKHYYQVKTSKRKYRNNETVKFNLNIRQANDYYTFNYPIDVIGFGSPSRKIAVLLKINDFKLFWAEVKKYKINKYKDYISFTISDIENHGIHHKVIDLATK